MNKILLKIQKINNFASKSKFQNKILMPNLKRYCDNSRNRPDNRHGSVGLFLVPTTILKPRFTILDEWNQTDVSSFIHGRGCKGYDEGRSLFQCSRTMSRVWSSAILFASIPQFGFCRGIQLCKSASESRIRSYHDAEIGGTAFCATSGGDGSLPEMAGIIGLCRSATLDISSSQR